MKFIKKIYEDLKNRLIGSPKSTITGILALVTYLTSMYGFDVPPAWIAAISSLLLTAMGLLKKDK